MDALGQLEWDIDWHTHARRAHLLLLAGMWLFPKHSSSVTSSATSVDVELDALAASLNQLDFDIAEREQRLLQMEHVYINLRVNLDIYRRQTSTLGGHEWLPTLIKKGRARRETASAHALSDGVPKEQRVALMRKLIASFAAQLTERDEALELLQAEISDLEAEKSVLHEAIGNAIANATRASGTADATPTAAATASVTSANDVTSGANVTLQMMSAAAQSNVARADVASLVTEEKTLDIHLSVPPPGGRMGIALTDKNEIADLADGQLAQQCGLMVGDIIIAVDGQALYTEAGERISAALYLSRTQDDPPHAQRRLVVIRHLVPSPPTPLADGMERQYGATTEEEGAEVGVGGGERASEHASPAQTPPARHDSSSVSPPPFDVAVVRAMEGVSFGLGLDIRDEGIVVISRIDSGSPAWELAHLVVGDYVLSVNGQKVTAEPKPKPKPEREAKLKR